MRIFTINKHISVVCNSEKTRYGFRHLATVTQDGRDIGHAKCCYYNRTWESYEFQSVLHAAINNTFDEKTAKKYIKKLERKPVEKDHHLHAVAAVCAIGDVLCDTQEQKNAWKKRMLRTVHGIDFPADFDQLPEDEKTRRLDNALLVIKEV